MTEERVFERKIYGKLREWFDGPYEEALMIEGARQVGKTYVVRRFLEQNRIDYFEMNFVEDDGYAAIFDGSLDVDRIIGSMVLAFEGFRPVPGETVLFLDEIQLCPNAVTALKMFVDDGRYRVIASGSLLGMTLKGMRSVPMGSVRYERMYSMDFDEFLWALGVSRDVTDMIRRSIRERTPFGSAVLKALDGHFSTYMAVGGMPKAVSAYTDSRDFRKVRSIQRDSMRDYRKDIANYADTKDKDRILACFDSIPGQLAKESTKFVFKYIDAEFVPTYDTYRASIDWMVDAAIVNVCNSVTAPSLPLETHTEDNKFKLYFHDTGLLVGSYGPEVAKSVLARDAHVNRGPIAENVVAECLAKYGKPIRYFATGSLEIDFITVMGGSAAAIEVKSGNNRRARSLKSLKDRFGVKRRMVLEMTDIHVDDEGIEHYPLFAAAYFDEMQPEPELKADDGPDEIAWLNSTVGDRKA